MFAWLRARLRERLLPPPFPAEWTAILERNVAHWRHLDAAERERLRARVQAFVEEKHWEGCGGLEMTDEIRVTIAALACLLALGFDRDPYGNVASILVYPSTVVVPGHRTALGPGVAVEQVGSPIAGQAMMHGPVLVVWDAVLHGAIHPEKGHNVVYHELAHKLDMLDGWVDGVPPLAGRARRERWSEVFAREQRELERRSASGQRTLIDPYGTTSPAEFFAVVTEAFFDRPSELLARHGDLYETLRDFYRQDPAARERRKRAAGER